MYSSDFPKMISGNKAKLIADHDAIKNNLILLLYSDKLSLFGDPNFGTAMNNTIFEQPSMAIKDLIIDELMSVIITYMPSIYVKRKDIDVYIDGTFLRCSIRCTYNDTGETDLFDIALTSVGIIES